MGRTKPARVQSLKNIREPHDLGFCCLLLCIHQGNPSATFFSKITVVRRNNVVYKFQSFLRWKAKNFWITIEVDSYSGFFFLVINLPTIFGNCVFHRLFVGKILPLLWKYLLNWISVSIQRVEYAYSMSLTFDRIHYGIAKIFGWSWDVKGSKSQLKLWGERNWVPLRHLKFLGPNYELS